MLSLYLAVIEDHRDDSKFEELYYKYRNMMFSVALKILKSESLAEDATQEALFSVAKNIQNINTDNEDITRSYLFVVVKNASYRVYKREKKNRIISIDSLYSLADKRDLYETVSEDEQYVKTVECIMSLPEIYRDVLSLHYVQGMNAVQIAASMDIKCDTARHRLHRGKRMLAEKMEEIYAKK